MILKIILLVAVTIIVIGVYIMLFLTFYKLFKKPFKKGASVSVTTDGGKTWIPISNPIKDSKIKIVLEKNNDR